jgi:nucleotide-binding universal stress UspA family protein
MRGPIVAGTDSTETSRLALIEAGSLAEQSNLDVVVVFVRHARFSGTASVFAVGAVRGLEDSLDSEQALAYAQSVAILDPLNVRWTFEVRSGTPASELMCAAKACGAETIVVAGRRHGAVGGVTSSSVSAQLFHRWPHTLLVVHPPAEGATTTHSGSTSVL